MARRDALAHTYLAQAAAPGRHGEHWSGPPQMVERIARRLSTGPGTRVLDVGSGVGGPARRLASRTGCTVVGVDVLEPLVRMAARRLRPAPEADAAGVHYVAASAEALPFDAASFDQVWCLGTAAHIPDLDRFAREVARVLAGGGRLAVSEAFWDGRRPPRFAAVAPAPWRPVTVDALALALAGAGFAGVERLPWPGNDRPTAGDPALRTDLAEGRLRPALVVAERR